MKVTKVWINKYEKGNLLGFANVDFSLDDSNNTHVEVRGFSIFRGENGITMSVPSQEGKKGKLDDRGNLIYYPIFKITKQEDGGPANDFYEYIRSEIETAYNDFKGKKNEDVGRVTKTSNVAGDIQDDDLPF